MQIDVNQARKNPYKWLGNQTGNIIKTIILVNYSEFTIIRKSLNLKWLFFDVSMDLANVEQKEFSTNTFSNLFQRSNIS